MEEVYLLVYIDVMPGKTNQKIEAYQNLKPLVLAEPGRIQYQRLSDEHDENKFVLIDIRASQATLDAHEKPVHMLVADACSPTYCAKTAYIINTRPVI